MEYILLGFLATVAIFTARNELIYRYLRRAQAIDPSIPVIQLYEKLLCDLTKWTFRQCFPELGDRR